ncbi:MAG: hypothetical protein ACERKP_09005 [Deltaproteobacteria bacterium]
MKISLKTLYFFFVAAIYLFNCPVFLMADEKGQVEVVDRVRKQIISAEMNQVRCYQSTRYFVVAKDLESRGGTDFLVKYKSTADEKLPCSYLFGNYDFEIKNEWAEYFAGLAGNFLILDSTTGPGPSGLIIWDLKKRKKVYEGSWSDPIEIKDDSIIYWTETGEATDDNCPERAKWESHGLGAAIETKVIFNLFDFSVSKTKETRCSPRQ